MDRMHRFPLLAFAAVCLAQTPAAAPAKLPDGLYVTILTDMGSIKARLFEKEAPKTVANFTALASGQKAYLSPLNGLPARKPFYDGLIFHRVIPNFMIQGGDPLGNGTGGAETIPDEFDSGLKFDVAGRLGMANAGPNTGSCQFFITEAPTPHLDGLHTVFGQVMEGFDLVGRIARVESGNDRPLKDVPMKKVTIERIGPEPGK